MKFTHILSNKLKLTRSRNYDKSCISCGETNPPDLHGGQWDCDHFLSVGSHPELRFDERVSD